MRQRFLLIPIPAKLPHKSNILMKVRSIIHYSLCLLWGGMLLIGFTGCNKDEPATGNTSVTMIFPLKTGNSWKYHTLLEERDTNNVLMRKEEYDNYWTVLEDTMINGAQTFKMEFKDVFSPGKEETRYSYYSNPASGLYGVATLNSFSNGYMWFKTGTSDLNLQSGLCPLINGYGKGEQRGLTFPADSALYILKYPMKINDMWETNEYGAKLNFRKKYTGLEIITVPAGTFRCMKAVHVIDKASNGDPVQRPPSVSQYYGTKGLMKQIYFNELKDGTQYSKLSIVTELVSTNIN